MGCLLYGFNHVFFVGKKKKKELMSAITFVSPRVYANTIYTRLS